MRHINRLKKRYEKNSWWCRKIHKYVNIERRHENKFSTHFVFVNVHAVTFDFSIDLQKHKRFWNTRICSRLLLISWTMTTLMFYRFFFIIKIKIIHLINWQWFNRKVIKFCMIEKIERKIVVDERKNQKKSKQKQKFEFERKSFELLNKTYYWS